MKKNMLFVAAVLTGTSLAAQQDTTQQLDQVVVTANKYPQKLSSTGKVLSVITREQLEQNTGRSLPQLLNEQAGLVINGAQNPLGTNATVYLRGAGAASTLILVNGMPANDASGITGEFDLNQFSIDQVERVEILKGSQSVLYGSDAVAGVINIITRKAAPGKAVHLDAVAAGGSYGTFKGGVGLHGTTGILQYAVRYNRLQATGFSAAADTAGGNYEKDGFSQDVVSLQLGLQATKRWRLSLNGQAGAYKADLDDAAFTDDANNTTRNRNQQLGLSSLYNFGKGTVTVNLNLNNTRRQLDDAVNVPTQPNDYDPYNALYKSRTLFGEVYVNTDLQQHIGLLAGADIRKQEADITSSFGGLGADSLKATQVSGFASLFIKDLQGFSAELGGRFTHHDVAGDAVTFSVNPSWVFNKQWKVFANVASGFRAPTIYNLASEYGNKTLKPERSMSYEGGVQYLNTANTLNLRATYFDRRTKDVIIFSSLFVPPYGQYNNADKQDANGVELEATWRPNTRWLVSGNYAYVDGAIETSSAATGKDTSFYNLYRRPKHNVNATISFEPTEKLNCSLGFRAVGERDDIFFNPTTFGNDPVTLKAYYNLDLYLSYKPVKALKLFADLRNITNQSYQELYGYNTRKFNLMAGALLTL